MRAVLCPVCKGNGKLTPQGNYAGYYEVTCHGCNGKGWVEVREDTDDILHSKPIED